VGRQTTLSASFSRLGARELVSCAGGVGCLATLARDFSEQLSIDGRKAARPSDPWLTRVRRARRRIRLQVVSVQVMGLLVGKNGRRRLTRFRGRGFVGCLDVIILGVYRVHLGCSYRSYAGDLDSVSAPLLFRTRRS
jgi:hypothetical protein